MMRFASARSIARSAAGIVFASAEKADQSIEGSIGQMLKHVDVGFEALCSLAPAAVKQRIARKAFGCGIVARGQVDQAFDCQLGMLAGKLFNLSVALGSAARIAALPLFPRCHWKP